MGKSATAAKDRYNAKSYDDIRLRVPKGEKEVLQAHVATTGDESLNGFIIRAIREPMERDKQK